MSFTALFIKSGPDSLSLQPGFNKPFVGASTEGRELVAFHLVMLQEDQDKVLFSFLFFSPQECLSLVGCGNGNYQGRARDLAQR